MLTRDTRDPGHVACGDIGRCHVGANIQPGYFLGNMKHIHQSDPFVNSCRRRRLIRRRSVVRMNQESGNLGLRSGPDEWLRLDPTFVAGGKKQLNPDLGRDVSTPARSE